MYLLKWNSFSQASQFIFSSSTSGKGSQHWREHSHDFYECFLVESGSGIHCLAGEELPLRTGELWLIRPEHSHSFRAARGHRLTLLNVAIQAREVESVLVRRLLPAAAWKKGGCAFFRQLQQIERDRFRRLAKEVSQGPRDLMDAGYFLMGLARMLRRWKLAGTEVKIPAWMEKTLAHESETELLQGGLPMLLRMCGRSHEHTSRSFRKYLGQSPTEWLNGRRINYARYLLETSNFTVLEVAMECGFENLSYFHRTFKARLRQTPLNYRIKAQSVQAPAAAKS